MKYGDAVVLVKKDAAGVVTRVNAIVLASSLHAPTTADRKPLKDERGELLPVEEHLDIAFPVLTLADGQVLKTRNMEEIFRPAYDVRVWVDGAWIGFEDPNVGHAVAGLSANEIAPGELTELGERWNELHAMASKAAAERFYEEYPDQRPAGFEQGSGSEKYGASDWTAAGMDKDGFPVAKGSPEDVTTVGNAVEGVAAGAPSADDLDVVTADQAAKDATILVIETKQYADGSSATGVAPLPDLSPEEQATQNQALPQE